MTAADIIGLAAIAWCVLMVAGMLVLVFWPTEQDRIQKYYDKPPCPDCGSRAYHVRGCPRPR